MSRYVDAFLIPIKKKNIKAYKKMAMIGAKVWMEHGALDYYECIGDELNITWAPTFIQLCKLKKDETAVMAFIVYKSKAHAKAVNNKVMKDHRMDPSQYDQKNMPFSMERFTAGKFKTLVHKSAK